MAFVGGPTQLEVTTNATITAPPAPNPMPQPSTVVLPQQTSFEDRNESKLIVFATVADAADLIESFHDQHGLRFIHEGDRGYKPTTGKSGSLTKIDVASILAVTNLGAERGIQGAQPCSKLMAETREFLSDRLFKPLAAGDPIKCLKEVFDLSGGSWLSTERYDATLITNPRDAVNGNVVVQFHNKGADQQVRPLRGIKLKGDKRSELHCQMLYVCNRGGAKLNRKTTTKTPDAQTKQNHGFGCKSTFTIRKYFNDPRLLVDAGNALCATPGGCGFRGCNGIAFDCHHNHQIGDANAKYTGNTKKTIAVARAFVSQGNSASSIARTMQNSAGARQTGVNTRLLLKPKSVHNAMRGMHQYEKHQDDETSTQMWVDEMRQNSTLLAYKAVGSLCLEIRGAGGAMSKVNCITVGVGQDDFILAGQTSAMQRAMRGSRDFAAFDATHHTTKHNKYQLFLMHTHDAKDRGMLISFSLNSSGAHPGIAVWLTALLHNGLDPELVMVDCDLAEALAVEIAWAALGKKQPRIFWCHWHGPPPPHEPLP